MLRSVLVTIPTPSVLGGVTTILRARWRVAVNTLWRGKTIRKVLTVSAVVGLLVASYFVYAFSRFLVRLLREALSMEQLQEFAPGVEAAFAALPGVTLLAFAVPMLLGSISFALSTLYFARDLDMLLVSPVPVRSVFIARFGEGMIPSYLLLFVLAAPALVGYGHGLGFGLVFPLAVVVILLLLPLLPFGLGALLTMLLVKVIPPRRLREALAVVGGLLGVVFYIGSQLLTQPGRRIRIEGEEVAGLVGRWDLAWLPTAWAARSLLAIGVGDWSRALLWGAPYLLATLGLWSVCVVLAERLYIGGWLSLSGTAGGRVRRRARAGAGRETAIGNPMVAVMRKDLLTLRRDPQQLTQLLFPLAIAAFWVWRVATDARLNGLEDVAGASDLGLVSIAVFIGLLISSTLGLSALSREGRGYWLLHLAPIDPLAILRAKWLLAWLPFPAIALVYALLTGILGQVEPLTLVRDVLVVLLTGAGVAGITVGMGAIFPRFNWQQPNRMASTQAGCLGSASYFLYTGAMLALTLGPSWIGDRLGGWVWAAGWGGALAITAAALTLPMLIGAARLRAQQL